MARGPLARFESGFVGQIYEAIIRRPILGTAEEVRKVDSRVVDSALVGLGSSTENLSQALKTTVSGHAQYYGLTMAAGILVLVALALFLT
jgi:hypothetical protein